MEPKVQLALRLAFASRKIQGRYKHSHMKNKTASDMNICVLLVGFCWLYHFIIYSLGGCLFFFFFPHWLLLNCPRIYVAACFLSFLSEQRG